MRETKIPSSPKWKEMKLNGETNNARHRSTTSVNPKKQSSSSSWTSPALYILLLFGILYLYYFYPQSQTCAPRQISGDFGGTLQILLEDYVSRERLQKLAKDNHAKYMAAKPFPHIAFDNFFPEGLLEAILLEFPDEVITSSDGRPTCKDGWQCYGSKFYSGGLQAFLHQEIPTGKTNELFKMALDNEEMMGVATRLTFMLMRSPVFLEFLETLTGIGSIVPDPGYRGSGLHQTAAGGNLNVHADFNLLKAYKLDRRVNTFLYLNKDWRNEWGGHLELWNREKTKCEEKIAPLFNRFVVFSSTDFTYHGHPNPLMTPRSRSRRSIALYYYTNGRPQEELVQGGYESHSTLFVDVACHTCNQCSADHKQSPFKLEICPESDAPVVE